MPQFSLSSCLTDLAQRNPGRTEADIQSDIKNVLLFGGFDLGDEQVKLESPAPDRKRIDVEVGALVIECKRDLTSKRVVGEAEIQLGGYLFDREALGGGSYVGILTDGVIWRCYRSDDDAVELVSTLELRPGQVDERKFRWWLGSLLATERLIVPTASTIEERLGSESPACRLILAELEDLWNSASKMPEVLLKRALWAKLLRTALGTQFEDADALFIQHTYLVLVATLIAHVVIGFDAAELQESPGVAVSGQLFAKAGIKGVGEAGFFDWALDTPGGASIVSDIARRLGVFAWTGVDHDVLKALYQSVVDAETRHRLGEYYTPDWLAKKIIEDVVDTPLRQTVLDPSCGSGTFLFHAIRHYLAASEAEGVSLHDAICGVTSHVYGLDLHPVAVVLAQVTYLLAIGTDRVSQAAAGLSVPVYLGDSMRWDMADETFLSQAGDVIVPTGIGQTMFGAEELRFPSSVVSDPAQFDRLVDAMAERATNRARGTKPLSISGVLAHFGIAGSDKSVLEETYQHLCDLHDQERNHIWGFFVRNQSRPTWFATETNRADVLVGNPPWLAYGFMPTDMQQRFRTRAKDHQLWKGGTVAVQQDLSAFFVARSIELYLRVGGKFGFVMPLATLSRKAYEGFRYGDYSSKASECAVAFDAPWDLDKVKPDIFPIPASVVLGQRVDSHSHNVRVPMPASRLSLAGRLDSRNSNDQSAALTWTVIDEGSGVSYTSAGSPYSARFFNGATLYPRMLILVEEEASGPLPLPKTQQAIRSRRGKLDKPPWKLLPDQTGVIETIFLRDAYLGENCLPFRMLTPVKAAVPFDGKLTLSGDDDRIENYPKFANWWRNAEQVWTANAKDGKISLLQQVDHFGKLSTQFPASEYRVVYTKAGNYLTSAIVDDCNAVIDHKLYWGAANSLEEARYLTAVLNAPALGKIVEPYQSRGAFGARDFDKYVWYPPIPEYDADDKQHVQLARLAEEAERVANEYEIEDGVGFQKARSQIRALLQSKGIFDNIDRFVLKLLQLPKLEA